MNNKPSVIIPLDEYQELVNMRDNILPALSENKTVIRVTDVQRFSGFRKMYTVINPPELLARLEEEFFSCNSKANELALKVYELEGKPLKKKRFWLW